jgi:hypothetical protein
LLLVLLLPLPSLLLLRFLCRCFFTGMEVRMHTSLYTHTAYQQQMSGVYMRLAKLHMCFAISL